MSTRSPATRERRGRGDSDSTSGKLHRLRLSLRQYTDQTEKWRLSCYTRKSEFLLIMKGFWFVSISWA